MISAFRDNGLGLAVVRDDSSKNILAVLSKQDLMVFIMRMFSVQDREKILEEPVNTFKIMRSKESVISLKESDSLFHALVTLKKTNVSLTRSRLCLF